MAGRDNGVRPTVSRLRAMRAVTIDAEGGLAVRQVALPEPGSGQVRVRVVACGICGSDLHMRASASLPAGTVMGHEFAGEVDAVGPDVTGFGGGEPVCVFPAPPVDRHDFRHYMTTGIGLGAAPGGFAEAVIVGADQLWRLPDSMAVEHGALVEPLAVALHGINRGGVGPDRPAAVVGAGPIGVMTALALRARGTERLVVLEPNELRRERMGALGIAAVGLDGARAAVRAELGGDPAVVYECAGHPSAPALAIELVASTGCVVLLGALDEPVEISQITMIAKETDMRASFGYRPGDFTEAVELIAAGRIPVDRVVTAVEPLERAEEMFDALTRPDSGQLKVLLRP